MTPKQKADELIERHYQVIIDVVDVNNAYYYSKSCALTTVDEIINDSDTSSPFDEQRLKYWKEVKTEIENP